VLLGGELTRASQNKTAMLSQLDHLTAFAMQMTKKLAAHEKEETIAAREQKHLSNSLTRKCIYLEFCALLLHMTNSKGLAAICHRLLVTRQTAKAGVQDAELQHICIRWRSVARMRQHLGALCEITAAKCRAAQLEIGWSAWHWLCTCAVDKLSYAILYWPRATL